MSVDPNSVWYLARDGKIIWQGTASELRSFIAHGDIRGSEAAWTDGFSAWVPVSSHQECAWIREAVAEHDELTGLHTEFSNPEGTAALNLPTYIEEGDSPFAGPRPGRERRGKGGRRVTDQPGASGRAGRRDRDRRVIGTVGLPVGLLAGIAIGLGVAFLAWNHFTALQSKKPVQVTGAPTVAPTKVVVTDTGPAAKPVKDASTKAPAEKQATTSESKATKPKAETPIPKTPSPQPTPTPTRAPDAGASVPAAPAAKTPSVRIVKKKSGGVEMPSDSQDREAEIKRSMRVRKGIWDACILRAQRDYPALVGRLAFTISVTKQGSINGVTGPTGNAGAQYAAACLLGEFSNLTFPPGRAAQVKFNYDTP